VDDLQRELNFWITHWINNYKARLNNALSSTPFKFPERLIGQFSQRYRELRWRLEKLILHQIDEYKNSINALETKLSVLSPLNVLERGYSIAFRLPENEVIRDAEVVKKNDSIRVRLHRGELLAKVEQVTKADFLCKKGGNDG
jgi:exodeoxyribonuclease VII large subunit